MLLVHHEDKHIPEANRQAHCSWCHGRYPAVIEASKIADTASIGSHISVSPLQTVSLEGAPISVVATVEQYLIRERARLRQQREAAEASAQAAEAAAALGMARNRTAGQWENPAR